MASGFSEGGGRSVRVRDRDVTTEAEMWDEGDKRRHGARCGRGGEARSRGAQRPADPADAGPGRERTPPAGPRRKPPFQLRGFRAFDLQN